MAEQDPAAQRRKSANLSIDLKGRLEFLNKKIIEVQQTFEDIYKDATEDIIRDTVKRARKNRIEYKNIYPFVSPQEDVEKAISNEVFFLLANDMKIKFAIQKESEDLSKKKTAKQQALENERAKMRGMPLFERVLLSLGTIPT